MKKTKSQPLISRIYTFFINLFQIKREEQKSHKCMVNNKENWSHIKKLNQTKDSKRKREIKALIAEDNHINIKIMQYSLKSIGISSDIAENGKIAYEMRIKNQYDIIFMDIQMPMMDGIESKNAILKYEREHSIPHIPIVAVTANALKGDRERFLTGGMDEYISKPINIDKFTTVIKKFFPTYSLG